MAAYFLFELILLLHICYGQNQIPVVGILTVRSLSKHVTQPRPDGDHHEHHLIQASYVKWLESAGAQSIPIPYDAPDELVEEIFTQINGLLLPGGKSKFRPTLQKLWDLAMESNLRGDYFPVFGICKGMEHMIRLASKLKKMRRGFDAQNISLPLIFPTEKDVITSNGVFSTKSLLYPEFKDRQILSSSNITMNNHHKGITPDNFIAEKALSLFKITSISYDRKGKPFVSSMESFEMPFYAVMYHPEKSNFEYGLQPNSSISALAIDHSENAVALSMRLAFFFVRHVRKNKHLYRMFDRHPFVHKYEIKGAVSGTCEQVYTIPPTRTWTDPDGCHEIKKATKKIKFHTSHQIA